MSHQDRRDPSFNVNSRYRTNFATVGGSYSYAEDYQQAMLSLSCNVVAHSQGEPYRVCRRVNILRDYPDDKIKIYP